MSKLSELLNTAIKNFYQESDNFQEHISDKSNPHEVTKSQVNLGRVENILYATKEELLSHKEKTVIDHPDKSITSEKIADGAVGTEKIADNSITTAKIWSGAISQSKIKNGAVITGKIDNKAVTTEKIADNAVTAEKIAEKAVTAEKVASGAITEEKIGAGAVTAEKLGVVPIEKGGTGAGTATDAVKALGALERVKISYAQLDSVFVPIAFYSAFNENNEIYEAPFTYATIITGHQSDDFYTAESYYQIAIDHQSGKIYMRNIDKTAVESKNASGCVWEDMVANETGKITRNEVNIQNANGGFSAGANAECSIDALQLGEGLNDTPRTLKAYDYTLIDENGNIPAERLENSAKVKLYGVRFEGSANSGASVKRLFDSPCVAGVGTDTEAAVNEFDNIYPWSARRRCNGYFYIDNQFKVTAYEGEPGFKTNGSNGNVWVEHSLFYYKHTKDEDGSEEIIISPVPLSGYRPAPIFLNEDGSVRQKAYTAAYQAGSDFGLLTSYAGIAPHKGSISYFMSSAKNMPMPHTIQTIAEVYTRWLYMTVEFATRDMQSVMKGCVDKEYSGECVSLNVNENGAVVLAREHAQRFSVGQIISIGSELGKGDIAKNRKIIYIGVPESEENGAIFFDGDTVNVPAGSIVYAEGWATGVCDSVISSSGSPKSNTDGKNPCIYRGEENPYGETPEYIGNLLFKRKGSGTADNPYSYEVYYIENPNNYSGGITANYQKIGYDLATKEGYISKAGYDERYPFIMLPTETDGSSATYYADYFDFETTQTVAVAGVGGKCMEGTKGGPFALNIALSPTSDNKFAARISYYQGGVS